MADLYEKIDKDTLEVTSNDINIRIHKESRTEIQTKLDHLKLDKSKMELEYKNKIEAEESKLAVLDS